jgi:hypothetical protein
MDMSRSILRRLSLVALCVLLVLGWMRPGHAQDIPDDEDDLRPPTAEELAPRQPGTPPVGAGPVPTVAAPRPGQVDLSGPGGLQPAPPGASTVLPPLRLPSDAEILARPEGWRVEGFRLRFSYYDQYGHGYQSQAGPRLGPGSERVTVAQGIAQVDIRQSDKVTHSITVPVDVISAASPNALDAISNASSVNESATIQISSHYQHDAQNEFYATYGFHVEEPFRSWNVGVGYRRHLAQDNAVLGVSFNQTIDWFDRLSIYGGDFGRTSRSTSNLNLALSQILSTTTVGQVSYGYSAQVGELSNTWNAVPLSDGSVVGELLPGQRHRHALQARIAQYLPWRGSAKLLYRYYVDTFKLQAHTTEVQVYQYLGRHLYLRATYRYHYQTGADFFATRFPSNLKPSTIRTADSDLAPFGAHLYGVKLVANLSAWRQVGWRYPEFHLGFERYTRSNDLQVNIYSSGISFRF